MGESLKDSINIVPEDVEAPKGNPLEEIKLNIDKAVKEGQENLQKGLGEIQKFTQESITKIQTSTGETFVKVGDSIKENTAKFGDSIKENTLKVGDNIKKETLKVGDSIKENTAKMGDSIKENTAKFGESVKENTLKMGDSIKENSVKFGESVKENTLKMGDSIKENSVKFGESVKENSIKTYETVSTKTVEVVQAIPGAAQEVSTKTVEVVKAIPGAVKELPAQTEKAYQTIKTKTEETLVQIDASTKEMQAKVGKFYAASAPYYMGTAPATLALLDEYDILPVAIAKASLLGISKVLYCDSVVTGGLIWLSIFIVSPLVALGGLISLAGSSTCSILTMKDADSSLAGANAFLVGTFTAIMMMDASFFFRVIPATLVLGPLCWYVQEQIAFYTSYPLLWSSNLVLVVVGLMVAFTSGPAPPLVDVEVSSVIYIGSLLGVTVYSPIIGGALIAATAVELLFSWLVLGAASTAMVYQAGLTAVALVYTFSINKVLVVLGFLAVVSTCALQLAMDELFVKVTGFPFSFTLAFCCATMPLLVSEKPLTAGLATRDLEAEPVLYEYTPPEVDEEAPATEETPLIPSP